MKFTAVLMLVVGIASVQALNATDFDLLEVTIQAVDTGLYLSCVYHGGDKNPIEAAKSVPDPACIFTASLFF